MRDRDGSTGRQMAASPGADQPTREILDGFFELISRVIGQGEKLAQHLAIPGSFIKALHTMECPMAMKELGKRMQCDPSFVTLVADMLEQRGLARREPHPADRRIKNLVLTSEGSDLRQRIETEISARMPWNTGLSAEEREQLLALIRKMLTADAAGAADAEHSLHIPADPIDSSDPRLARQANNLLTKDMSANPPASTGEVKSAASAPAAGSTS
jgi:MarR family transcriptional regulator, organic hydroperoxide resistance regulator